MNKLISIFALTALLHTTLILRSLAQGRLDRPTFFREGQERMEREIQRLQQQPSIPSQALEHPSQLLTIDDGQLRWQKYLFQNGGFSIWMPQGVKSDETVKINTAIGELSFEVFASHPSTSKFANTRFIAAYSDPLNSDQLKDEKALLEAVKQGILDRTDFQLIQENPLQLSQYQGQELIMQGEDELITFRVYLIKERVYVLAVGQPNQDGLSAEITSYFDSFRLL